MSVEIASAYVSIIPTFKGIDSKLNDMFSSIAKQGDKAGADSGDSFLGGFKGKALAGIAGVGLALGATLMDAYTEALDVKKSQAKLQASLGISPDQAKNLGKTASRLYSAGYGDSLDSLLEQVGSVQSAFQNLKLPDDQLEKLTGKALSFSQAFGGDVESIAQNVNTLLGSGLTKNADEAFDLLTKASQKVPAALRGDIADASDEYSQFFRTLGFSGDEAFDALVKGADKGTFGIDKTGDAIKEFTIRATDMSSSSVDAFKSIGLDAKSMTDRILAGGDDAKGAFDQITDGILAIQDPAAQSQAALALFGTPLEDMNVQDIPEFLKGLKGMSGGMGDAAGAADAMDQAMGSTTSGIELLWRNLKSNLVGFITDQVIPAVSEFTTWLADKLTPVISEVVAWLGEHLGPVIQKVAAFFTDVLVPAGQQAWAWFEENLLPTIQRVGEFISNTFGNLFTVLGGVIDFLAGVFTGDWSRAWDGIKTIFSGIWDQIQNIVSAAWDVVTGIGGRILDWLGQLAPWAWEKISAFGSFLVEKGAQFLQWIWDGITTKAVEVWAWFTALPGSLWEQVQAGAGWLVDRGKDFIQWIWDGITAKFGEVQQWFLNLPSALWGAIQGAWSTATQWGGQLIKYIIDGISGSDPYIAAELSRTLIKAAEAVVPGLGGLIDLTGVDVDKNINDYLSSLSFSRNAANAALAAGLSLVPGRATGGLFGPYDGRTGGQIAVGTHGTADDVLIRGSRNEFMVNEKATAQNLPLLWHINAGGNPADFFGRLPGFANGGLIGSMGMLLGASLVKAILPSLTERVADSTANAAAGSAFIGNGQWGPATDGSSLAANTAAAKAFITQKWGITDIGGVYGGSVPGSDHPIGKALDVMIANYLSAAGIAQGTSVADWFVGNPNAFGTKYVIWRDRINQGGSWAPYQHPSGSNDTLQHRDHVHLSFLTGTGQFSGGAQVAADDKPTGLLGSLASALTSGFMAKVGGITPVTGGSGVERWRSTMLRALGITGQPASYANRGLMQMDSESSGNERAVNTWDRNFPLYGGSKGLMQVIDPTFRQYAMAPWNKDIFDPLSNIIASIRYSLATYGSLDKAWRGVAYDQGGWLQPGGGQGVNLLNKPEAVLTPAQSDAYIAHAKAVANGFGGQVMRIELAGGDALTSEMVRTAKVTVDGKLQNIQTELATVRGQS